MYSRTYIIIITKQIGKLHHRNGSSKAQNILDPKTKILKKKNLEVFSSKIMTKVEHVSKYEDIPTGIAHSVE